MTDKKKITKAPARKPALATSAAILGRSVGPSKDGKRNGDVKIKAEWRMFYDRLLELREQLMRQMTGLA